MDVVRSVERALQGRAWEPDWRTSVIFALCAAALALLGFLGLFHRTLPLVPARRIIALRVTPPSVRPSLPSAVPGLRARPLRPIAPQTLNLPPPAAVETMQSWLDAAMNGYREDQEGQAPFLPPLPLDDALSRALQARGKSDALPDGGSYRSLYGGSVMRFGDSCAEMHEIQASPSPTNTVIVGFMVPCPGHYRRTMADAVADWAKKVARSRPLPP